MGDDIYRTDEERAADKMREKELGLTPPPMPGDQPSKGGQDDDPQQGEDDQQDDDSDSQEVRK